MIRPHPSSTLSALGILVILGLSSTLQAVIVSGGDGTQNVTAPADDFGFANVGLVFDPSDVVFVSGTYLGDGWVLAAYHGVRNGSGGFSFGSVIFNGVPFSVDPSSAVRLSTGIGPAAIPADLALFHLNGPYPVLPSLTLRSTAPTLSLTMAQAGDGRNRDTVETHWNVNTATDPDTWTETAGTGNRQGYKYGSGATIRWGMNKVSQLTIPVDDGFGTTQMFRTQFDNDASAIASECIAAPGDSGGGVFFKNGTKWELAGIMLATSPRLDGQPLETAVFTQQTFIADVSAYRSQILQVVPEPGSALLIFSGLGLLAVRRRTPRE